MALVRMAYSDVEAIMTMAGCSQHLFWMAAGVLQGDPLSGSIFVLVMDPFLRLLRRHVELPGWGVVRACADDVGASLSSVVALVHCFPAFDLIERAAGLALKPRKCKVVPLCPWSDILVLRIREWLQERVPPWQGFGVVPKAVYLGFQMGPSSD